MAGTFHNLRFNALDTPDRELRDVGTRPFALRGVGPARDAAEHGSDFSSDEAAARFYLGKLLGRDTRAAMRSLTAPERAEVVPDLRLQDAELSPLTNTRMVRFAQTWVPYRRSRWGSASSRPGAGGSPTR